MILASRLMSGMKSLASFLSKGPRILVVSDVHGNVYGLQAALEDGRHCDNVLCLGDIVGYGANPNECCAMLREVDAVCLAGNHDAAALGEIDIEWFNPVAKAAMLWTREALSAENMEWLGSLPPQGEWPVYGFQAVHASLRQPQHEYIVGQSVAIPTLDLMSQQLCFYGHTHEADVYRYLNVPGQKLQIQHKSMPNGGRFELTPPSKFLVNPGSCGQPRDGTPQAKYAIFNAETRVVEVRAVDYDYFSACAAIIDAGLPKPLGDRLFVGK